MAKKKEYRRHIRINGKMKKSPKGLSKIQADLWYQQQFQNKVSMKSGVFFASGSGPTLKEYFYRDWLPKRKKNHPQSTWAPDEQRFKDYVEAELGAHKISKINTLQIKSCLKKVVEVHGHSTKTRTRVQALLSKIFKDALNEDIPLVNANYVSGITFDDPRIGKREPPHLKKKSDVGKYLFAATSLGTTHLSFAVLGLFAALRKQEMIPLLWKNIDHENKMLEISRKFIQASNSIESGTKSGSGEVRHVPMADELIRVLSLHFDATPFKKANDFILSKPNGKHFGPRDLSRLNDEICKKAGIKINPHGLRHSMGRNFVAEGGGLKALQTIMGHSTAAVTELYSNLAGEQVKASRNVVKYEADDE